MTKALEDGADPHLALLAWRNTPSEHVQRSPAQIMFNRRTRTNLPSTDGLLASAFGPPARDALIKAKKRQAAYYNRGARERSPRAVGDTVRTRWFDSGEWKRRKS